MRTVALALATLGVALGVWDARSAAAPGIPQGTGTIQGRIDVREPAVERVPRPAPGALSMPRQPEPAGRRRSVVYLETAPRAAFDARQDPRARMDQRQEAFVPRVLAIVAGTTVDFPNSDVTFHNVFSLSKARTFDLGRYASGRSKSVRFDQPGIVRVFCDIHSHMSAYILVFAHRYFAVTDEEGWFRIEHVPAGTYTVVTWNEASPSQSRAVTVPDGGRVDVHFTLGRQ